MHSAPSSVQSLHLGLVPSHLDFRERQISHCPTVSAAEKIRMIQDCLQLWWLSASDSQRPHLCSSSSTDWCRPGYSARSRSGARSSWIPSRLRTETSSEPFEQSLESPHERIVQLDGRWAT